MAMIQSPCFMLHYLQAFCSRAWAVERYWQPGLEQGKIVVGGKNGDFVADGNGVKEEVGVCALDSLAATEIEGIGGRLVVAGGQFKVREGTQTITQFLELGGWLLMPERSS